jgi:hypothetical protein
MSMYPHRAMGGGPQGNSTRLNELLEQIRVEFDTQMRTTENYEHQSMSTTPTLMDYIALSPSFKLTHVYL